MIDTVLLDVDGTLIDSNEAQVRAWADTLRAHGWNEVTWQAIIPLIGMDGDKLLPKVIGIEAALAKAQSPPGDAIMIGDTPYDVAAARKAGVGTIALRCGGWGDEPLAVALAIYANPAELLARLDDSPLGTKSSH